MRGKIVLILALLGLVVVLAAPNALAAASALAPASAAAPPAGDLPAPASSPAPPAVGWEWRAGGNLRGVSFPDANNGWIVGDVGLLHVADGGKTWKAVPGMGRHRLNDVQFSDALNGWAVGEGGLILHTADGGAAWRIADSGTADELTDVLFVDNEWGWANGLHPIRTTDGGATWTPVARPDDAGEEWQGTVYFIDRGHGWLLSTSGFYRTMDGGTTWRRTATLPGGKGLFFIDAMNGWAFGAWSYLAQVGTLYRTTNGGETWSEGHLSAAVLALRFVSPQVGWAGGIEGGIWKSMDGGATWSSQPGGEINGFYFPSMVEGWAVGPGGNILHTTNAGTEWQRLDTFTASKAVEAIQFVRGPGGDAAGYAVGESTVTYGANFSFNAGLFMRASSTSGWSSTFHKGSGPQTEIYALDFLDDQRGWIALGSTGDSFSWSGWHGNVAVTTNAGIDWLSGGGMTGSARDIDMVDPTNGWVASGSEVCYRSGDNFICEVLGGISRTTNGGINWTGQLEFRGILRAVDMIDEQEGFVAGDGGAIYRTTDGGTNWVRQSTPVTTTLQDLFMFDATTGWAVGDEGAILHTSNGTTWAVQPASTRSNLRSVDFLDASRGWAVGTGGVILRTVDGGNHWSVEDSSTLLDLNTIDMLSETEGWAGGASGVILHYAGASARPKVFLPLFLE